MFVRGTFALFVPKHSLGVSFLKTKLEIFLLCGFVSGLTILQFLQGHSREYCRG